MVIGLGQFRYIGWDLKDTPPCPPPLPLSLIISCCIVGLDRFDIGLDNGSRDTPPCPPPSPPLLSPTPSHLVCTASPAGEIRQWIWQNNFCGTSNGEIILVTQAMGGKLFAQAMGKLFLWHRQWGKIICTGNGEIFSVTQAMGK